jgi:hypothetical protein
MRKFPEVAPSLYEISLSDALDPWADFCGEANKYLSIAQSEQYLAISRDSTVETIKGRVSN